MSILLIVNATEITCFKQVKLVSLPPSSYFTKPYSIHLNNPASVNCKKTSFVVYQLVRLEKNVAIEVYNNKFKSNKNEISQISTS